MDAVSLLVGAFVLGTLIALVSNLTA